MSSTERPLSLASFLYTGAVRRRRRWYARNPHARRRLARPVISIGSLTIGGSGKTPVVAHLVRLLIEIGERPAVLTRGYGREHEADGVVIASDGVRLRADVARAGDEPMMLARSIAGAAVLVSPDRFLAGHLAEQRFGASVHVLDDGFQHLALHRDIDLLVVRPADLEDERLLPGGRLREPIEAATAADAVLVTEGGRATAGAVAATLGARCHFRVARTGGAPRLMEPFGRPLEASSSARMLAVAGTAHPDRFFSHLRDAGWNVVEQVAFRDHHRFSRRDVDRIVRAADASRSSCVVTTEKDLMRLLPHRPLPVRVAWIPLTATVERAETFRQWLEDRLASARLGRLRAPARP